MKTALAVMSVVIMLAASWGLEHPHWVLYPIGWTGGLFYGWALWARADAE